MGCFIVLFALISPRLAIIFVWLFSNVLERAYDTFWLPLLGFFFLPWTTLAYIVAWGPVNDVSGLGWLLVAIGLAGDIATYSARSAKRRYNAAY